jgi:hypothetical protein
MNTRPNLYLRLLGIFALAFWMTACASASNLPWQQFTYDAINDGWFEKVDLLEYSYGDKDRMLMRSLSDKPNYAVRDGQSLPSRNNINGPAPVGDFLFVKWRDRATQRVYEQRVDLRDRLPKNMNNHGLTFLIEANILYVYYFDLDKPKKKEVKTDRSWRSAFWETRQIFPN